MRDLTSVWGVGPTAADRLFRAGCVSVKTLRAAVGLGPSGEAGASDVWDEMLRSEAGHGALPACLILTRQACIHRSKAGTRLCLQHHEELQVRVPRAEIAEIEEVVRAAADGAHADGSMQARVLLDQRRTSSNPREL